MTAIIGDDDTIKMVKELRKRLHEEHKSAFPILHKALKMIDHDKVSKEGIAYTLAMIAREVFQGLSRDCPQLAGLVLDIAGLDYAMLSRGEDVE